MIPTNPISIIKYNIDFFDFTNDSLFINSASLFNDPYHLNKEGAKILSNTIIKEVAKK